MPDSNKKKREFYLSVNEAAEKLRALAAELEKGVVTINEEKCSMAADTDVKIGLKAKGDTFSAKLKFKLANALSEAEEGETESTPAAETNDESYMDLKRRMSKDFKAIKKSCIQDQVLPESDQIERFYRDSKTMCTYPSKGKDFFETYLEQADLFYKAFKASDLTAMGTAVTALGERRKSCHEKHK
ncbi:MAG: GAK system XXXCH domain-containing protein [Candidatus Scalindua sp.]|nr:GAK system XXXCH domain-containing protein [Candidatus Scalindua sp.]MDV5166577.1 GAK system XXXCH domain-containing protein [Candidatus Scalindua sp.]